MKNRTILITGASSDIGNALIESIYAEFDNIIAIYNSSNGTLLNLNKTLGGKIIPYKVDFSDEDSLDNFIAEIKQLYENITHIVHLASDKITNRKFKDLNWNDYNQSIEIQLRSIVKILNAFLPSMAKNKYGKVVLMLTSCTINVPPKYLSDYVTTKYALLGLMKSLAIEYANKFVNINAVSPSMIETKFLENIPDLVIKSNAENNPMKRNATVNDIIPAMQFLLSDNTEYITGQNICISGGSMF